MKKGFVRLYALGCYALGLIVTLFYADFLGNGWFTGRIDGEQNVSWYSALFQNATLIFLFGLQHTIMARTGFKQKLRKVVSPHLERSTYVALTSAALGLLIWQWQPMPTVIYTLESTFWGNSVWVIYAAGWCICLFSTYLIDHFDLFGLRQAFWYGRGETPYHTSFRTPSLYKIVRHPVYLGWLLIHWSTPHLTTGRVLLAIGMTLYIFIGMYYEEKDLAEEFGETYQVYQKNTPRIIPFLTSKNKSKSNHETVSV